MKIFQPSPPCINCITLPICKTIITDKDEMFTIRTLNLLSKCSLLHDYVHSQDHLVLDRLNRAIVAITDSKIRMELPSYERKMY